MYSLSAIDGVAANGITMRVAARCAPSYLHSAGSPVELIRTFSRLSPQQTGQRCAGWLARYQAHAPQPFSRSPAT